MRAYFDSSALAKRYLPEPGAASVRAALRRGPPLVSRITLAELLSATGRAAARGVIDLAHRDRIWDRIEADFRELDVIEVRPAVLKHVRRLVARHGLRGYDAVQLASAVASAAAGATITFWSADAELVAAARAEGLRAMLPLA